MQTLAGEINFSNTSYFTKEEEDYKLDWSSNDIFPELENNYKVRVETIQADRGKILDRNGNILAGKQTASQVGFVPGKMNSTTKEQDIAKVAELLDISKESINNSLSASYVGEDTFVPLRTIRKTEQALKNQLLEIKGIKIIDTEERIYPLGEATSHLLGYIQGISKEELEEKKNEGYNEHSKIGKSGLEKIYENRLKAINGAEIYIINGQGEKVKTIAKKENKNGEDIKLTIDSNVQENLYEQFKNKVRKIKEEGINKQDFERIKKMIYGEYVKEYNDVGDIARMFLSDFMKGINSFDYIEEMKSIDEEYAKIVLDENFKEEKMVLSVVK